MVVRTCAKDSCGSHMTYCTDARYWVVEFIIDDSLTIVNLLQIVYTMQYGRETTLADFFKVVDRRNLCVRCCLKKCILLPNPQVHLASGEYQEILVQ